MSDNLVDVRLDKTRITVGEKVTATLDYTANADGRVHIVANNGFDVLPEFVLLSASDTTAQVELTLLARAPLPALCILTFTFVVNFQRAPVEVNPPPVAPRGAK